MAGVNFQERTNFFVLFDAAKNISGKEKGEACNCYSQHLLNQRFTVLKLELFRLRFLSSCESVVFNGKNRSY